MRTMVSGGSRSKGIIAKVNSLVWGIQTDSVSTSHGVTDNGMGTATALELLNYFVQHPPQNTLIFLFNNFEEGGLVGAQSFVHHPWFATIKLFVNLGKGHSIS